MENLILFGLLAIIIIGGIIILGVYVNLLYEDYDEGDKVVYMGTMAVFCAFIGLYTIFKIFLTM